MTIQEIGQKIKHRAKSRQGNDFLLVATLICVALTAFLLGRISLRSEGKPEVVIQGAPLDFLSAQQAKVPFTEGTGSASSPLGAIFASKNGTKYYFNGCSSQVKEENKIWFTSEDEALAAGFTKSSTCK